MQIYKIVKGFEKVEIDINTRDTGWKGRRHNKQIIKEKHVNTPINRNNTTWNMLQKKTDPKE